MLDERVIFEALANETASEILAYSAEQSRSVNELAEHLDVSPSTVYRRVETLAEQGLLVQQLQLDRRGNHYRVYRSTLKRVEVRLENEMIDTHIARREDVVSRFVRIWEDIRSEP